MKRRRPDDMATIWADMDAAQLAVAGLSGVLKQLLEAGFSQPAAEAIILQATGVSVNFVVTPQELEDGSAG